MAEKKKTTKTVTVSNNYELVKTTAFWGIIISGIAGLISVIFQCCLNWWVSGAVADTFAIIVGIVNLVAGLALFVSVFLAAYSYSRTQNKVLRILFWVFSVLALLAILGFNVVGMF